MFILDTNVVSELRRARSGKADPYVERWADSVDAGTLYISVITVLEIEMGVLQAERQDPSKGVILRRWFETLVLPAFGRRVLPVDAAVARCCAGLHIPDRRSERDALIAATGLVLGMTVVTRNVADFAPTGVKLLNPWSGAGR